MGEQPADRLRAPLGAVFLSYASEDSVAAERICASLRAAGVEVWFDQNELRGGDAWDAAIRKQIRSCALFIPVISVNTHARIEGYFRLEWKLAIDRSHLIAPDQAFLLPVAIDATSQTDERIPDRFRELHWTRLPAGAAPPAFVERVRQLLERLATSATASSAQSHSAVDASQAYRPPLAEFKRRLRIRPAVLIAGMVVMAVAYVAVSPLLPSKYAVDLRRLVNTPHPLRRRTHDMVNEAAAVPNPLELHRRHGYASDRTCKPIHKVRAKQVKPPYWTNPWS